MSAEYTDAEIQDASLYAWKIAGEGTPLAFATLSITKKFILVRNAILTGSTDELEKFLEPAAPEPKRPEPAVPVKKSVFPDYIICLEDGRKLKMLKRHLQTAYNMTPQEYRARWGLPSDYPMVAPGYAESRSAIAKSIGLGKKRVAK